ncbi:hypothetical protein WN48_03297 [Eufriesea mexicana]|uniref:Uncharacterized protein n=1 Tax=Eufriesea mexicana TaxID=516756 RepID=A0A310SAY4_9HYME|nr:hypothetical protein WN48_03297 [Eufriesea mexicana]
MGRRRRRGKSDSKPFVERLLAFAKLPVAEALEVAEASASERDARIVPGIVSRRVRGRDTTSKTFARGMIEGGLDPGHPGPVPVPNPVSLLLLFVEDKGGGGGWTRGCRNFFHSNVYPGKCHGFARDTVRFNGNPVCRPIFPCWLID